MLLPWLHHLPVYCIPNLGPRGRQCHRRCCHVACQGLSLHGLCTASDIVCNLSCIKFEGAEPARRLLHQILLVDVEVDTDLPPLRLGPRMTLSGREEGRPFVHTQATKATDASYRPALSTVPPASLFIRLARKPWDGMVFHETSDAQVAPHIRFDVESNLHGGAARPAAKVLVVAEMNRARDRTMHT